VLILFADFVISDIQRDHMESIEKLVPELASLRAILHTWTCTTMYFGRHTLGCLSQTYLSIVQRYVDL
jgi:hypothetical protein